HLYRFQFAFQFDSDEHDVACEVKYTGSLSVAFRVFAVPKRGFRRNVLGRGHVTSARTTYLCQAASGKHSAALSASSVFGAVAGVDDRSSGGPDGSCVRE